MLLSRAWWRQENSAIHGFVGDRTSLGDCNQVSCHGKAILLQPWATCCVQQPGMFPTDDLVGAPPAADRHSQGPSNVLRCVTHRAAFDTPLLSCGYTRTGRRFVCSCSLEHTRLSASGRRQRPPS